MKIKRLLQVLSTNWIHLVGFYLTTYLSLILFKIIGLETDDNWISVLFVSPFTIIILFLVYGLPIIGGFYLGMLLMDIFLFSWRNKWIKTSLIVEWILISLPFISWAFEYEYWLWITLSISFLTTQMIRTKKIKSKIQQKSNSYGSDSLSK